MDGSDKYIGVMLDSRYEILELIGKGGMALVYKARCHRLNRYVAIKILKEDLAGDEEFRRRFHTESQAVGMLSHPNIVAVYDVSLSDNIEYIVMELIEGITLKQYINRKGLLNWKEALHFSMLMTKALSHAHSRGIIHRDIKPHNIMILKDGSVKVADFGIARLLMMQNTLTQEALGSVHYISPEQAKGGNVDARSDIYSVGVVMYEMLTSRLPFVGESAVSVAIQHISAIPLMPSELNPDVPKGLEDITMHAMEPDLNVRFTTADEMLRDLEDFRKNPSVSFDYVSSEIKERQSSEDSIDHETRVLKTPDVSVPERKTAAPERKTTVPERKTATPERKTTVPERKIERIEPPRRKPVKKSLEMTDDEYRTVRKRAASTSTLIGVFFIILFLIAVVIFMWNYLLKDLFSPQEREQIEIPSFINRSYNDIINDEVFGEIFSFRPPIYVTSDDVAEGLVILQSPAGGSIVDAPLPGNKINVELTVSQGDEPAIQMPDLRNLHFIMARNTLEDLGLALVIIDDPVANEMERGYVISTVPAAGGPLARGYSVTITYSAGAVVSRVTVPDLVGDTRAQLVSAFSSLDITPNFIEWEHESPAGTVLFIQNAGQEIVVPATMIVHISSGPPEVPETPDPDETDPPDPDETDPPLDPDETEPPLDPDETDPPPDPDDTDPPPDPDNSSPPPPESGTPPPSDPSETDDGDGD